MRRRTRARRPPGTSRVIPIPGHTPGGAAYLWDGSPHRFLFTGDTVWLDHGEWSAVVLDLGARPDYVKSLALMRELDFDVLVPWGATQDEPSLAPTHAV